MHKYVYLYSSVWGFYPFILHYNYQLRYLFSLFLPEFCNFGLPSVSNLVVSQIYLLGLKDTQKIFIKDIYNQQYDFNKGIDVYPYFLFYLVDIQIHITNNTVYKPSFIIQHSFSG